VHQPDYTHIQEHALAEAAEAHGMLCGCLCSAAGYSFEDWLREILPAGRADPQVAETLRDVYAPTLAALEQPDMGFEPLLPSDAQPIDGRTTALAQWCQGFLYGLGAGRIPDASSLPGEVGEIVRDFAELTRAGVDGAELVEFVRVGVQLLFEELEAARRAPAPAPDDAAPLH
jgi:uncharacterized protein YgfB (UPF0149 family)